MQNETANEDVQDGEVIPFSEEKALAVFTPFQAQLTELKSLVESSYFDYEDPKQNQEARSLVHKVRKVKAAVEKARKEAKQSALDYGRTLDGKAKELTSEIEGIIEVHQKPLDEIEQREKDRKDAHQQKLDTLRQLANAPADGEDRDSTAIQGLIDTVNEFVVDDSLEEFQSEAAQLKAYALSTLEPYLAKVKKAEEERAELERLRQEEEKRKQQEHEERIAREAREQAERERQEAEAKAAAQVQEAEDEMLGRLDAIRKEAINEPLDSKTLASRRDLIENYLRPREDWPRYDEIMERWLDVQGVLSDAYEKACEAEAAAQERAEAEAREKAEQEAREAAEREAQQRAEREEQERQQRIENEQHKAQVETQAVHGLMQAGMKEKAATEAIRAISEGLVPHVTINY